MRGRIKVTSQSTVDPPRTHTHTPFSTSLTQKHISCHFPLKYTHSLWFWQNCHAWRPYSLRHSNKERERSRWGVCDGGAVCVCHLVSEHKWLWGGRKVGWWKGRGKIRQESGHLFVQAELRTASEKKCNREPGERERHDSKWSFVK